MEKTCFSPAIRMLMILFEMSETFEDDLRREEVLEPRLPDKNSIEYLLILSVRLGLWPITSADMMIAGFRDERHLFTDRIHGSN